MTGKARDVVIEERSRDEIATIGNRTFVPPAVPVRNPAFDATPMGLVSAIITENGIIRPPFTMTDLMQGKTK
jgi:methylthioribose-1-phosphate isomerase